MYIRHLSLQNLRTFERAELDLAVPPESSTGEPDNVTLLLGNNGAGKTTVLRALALGALAPVMASSSGYVPFSLVRRTGAKRPPARAAIDADLVLHEQDGKDGKQVASRLQVKSSNGFVDRIQPIRHARWNEAMFDEKSPAFLVLGYGASRRVEAEATSDPVRSKERQLRYQRVAGLFEEHVNLVPLSSWLPRFASTNPGRHKQVVGLINRLMFEGELLPTPDRDGRYLFRFRGSEVPFAAMSDGYRSYVGWIADLLYHVCMGAPSGEKLVDNRGIVLIDEIDLHLHPKWQRMVVSRLATALPRLQFVITSHSPLLVGTLPSRNVLALQTVTKRNGIAHSVIAPLDEELHGRSVDQILTSKVFGLESARDPEFSRRMAAVSAKAREGDADAARQVLRMMTFGAAAEPTRRRAKS